MRGATNILAFAPPPAIVRSAAPAVDMVFWYWGRPLRVVSVHGDDPAAPVIVEELMDGLNGDIRYGKGQLAMWSLAAVMRIVGRGHV